MDQAQRLDEQIVAAEERGYGKGYERGRIDGALDAVRGMEAADKAVDGARAEVAHGLFGPGIFGTGIDLSALDEDTALKLGIWTGEQIKAAEERGYARGKAEALTGWVSLPENVRMLISNAAAFLKASADGGGPVRDDAWRVWHQHYTAVLEGRFGRYALKADGSGVDTGGAT